MKICQNITSKNKLMGDYIGVLSYLAIIVKHNYNYDDVLLYR